MRPGLRCGFALLSCALAPAALAAPAHYIVFELDAKGRAEPVFYRQVEMDGAQSRASTGGNGHGDADRIGWQTAWRGSRGPLQRVDVPRHLHVEALAQGDELQRADVADPHRAFVLRLPLDQADHVEIVGPHEVQQFDLADIAARASTLALAGTPLAHGVRSRSANAARSANSANRLDLLLLGDGYTSAERATFTTHANALQAAMFGITPYKDYANFVNWQPGFVASAQSGADHPTYQAGCTTSSCCADITMQSDPRNGTFVNTALDSTYCVSQIHRTLYANSSKVFAAAAGFPDWDKILVIVNDPTYGGAGGSFAVQSAHAQAPRIVMHEFGHSFSGLADEYTTPYPGFPPCSDTTANPNCEANVTNQTTAAQVKWRDWFSNGIAIPTPAGTSGHGLFQGARYLSAGMYRPTDTLCLMRALGLNFCDVCKQEYVLELYRGGFGAPAGGIDLIEPGSEHPSVSTDVSYAYGSQRGFSATLLRPSVGAIGIQWYLDGSLVPNASSETYVFQQAGPTPATHTLELRVTDLTPLVKPAAAGNLLVHSRSWTIQVGNDRLFADGLQ